MDVALHIGLLGPLEVRVDGTPVDPGPAKVRRLLAALAVAAPASVAADTLAEVLWGETLPADPTASLHSYVSRLRRALGDARGRVVTAHGRYGLELLDDELDAQTVEGLIDRARRELADDDTAEASATLADALGLFRGPPLDEYAGESFAQLAAERWSELRISALEHQSEADLALGRTAEVVGRLESLVKVHPYRESLWRHLLIGLHREGRTADLERTARTLREVLRRDLDAEPSAETQALLDRLSAPEPVSVDPPQPPSLGDGAAPSLPGLLAAARRGPFVGRRASLAALEQDPTDAVLVLGESGIGKTRLTAEFADRAQRAGATVLAGGCSEHGQLAYEPVARALEAHLQGTTLEELTAAEPSTVVEIGRIVPGLAARAEVDEPPYVESAGIAPLVAAAVRNVLARASGAGTALLVIEDLHWADVDSQSLIAELVHDRPAGVGILLTSRPIDPDADHLVNRMLAERRARGIRLKTLSEPAVAALVTALSGETFGAQASARLHRASGGNPFFAVELLRAGWRGDAAMDDSVTTAGIAALVRQRVHRLSEPARAVLEVVAVGGAELAVDVLEECVDDDAIDEALAAGLITDPDPDTVTFTHLIVRDALLADIGSTRRRRLHQAIGRATLAVAAPSDERSLVQAARHLIAGKASTDRAAAVAALTDAATLAASRRAFGDAIQRLSDAVEVIDDPAGTSPESARLHIRLGWMLRQAGDRLQSLEIGRRTATMAGADRDPTAFADAALLQAPLRPDPAAAPALRAALARLGDRDPRRRARLLVEVGWALIDAEPAEADTAATEGSRLAVESRAFDATARALDHEWEHHALDSDPSDRLRRGRELAFDAAEAGDRVAAAHGHFHCAIAHHELGERFELRDQIERVVQLAGELRTPVLLAKAAQLRAGWHHLDGDLDAAEAAANEVFLHMPGDPSFVPIYGGQIVAIRTEQGQLDGMADLIAGDEANQNHPLSRSARAFVHAAFGRDEQARPLLDGLLDDGIDTIARDMSWLVTMATLADTTTILGDLDGAEVVWEHLLPFADRFVTFGYGAVSWGLVDRFLAAIALLRGDTDDAGTRLTHSLDRHRRFRAVPFIARDLLALGSLRRHDDRDHAVELLREARDLATSHQLLAVAWQAEDRLGELGVS